MVFNHTSTKSSSSFSRLKYYVYMFYICKHHVDVYICTCICFTFVSAMYICATFVCVYMFYIVSAMYIYFTVVCVYMFYICMCMYMSYICMCMYMSYISKRHVYVYICMCMFYVLSWYVVIGVI